MIASTTSLGCAHARPATGSRRVTAAPRTRRSALQVLTLERPPAVAEADVLLVPPPNFADLLPSMDGRDGFLEYESAAARMVDLERLSAELLENLKELNSASDALEAMPTPDFFQMQHQEARRAKRAAAREARKTQATATQAQTSTRSDPAAAVASSSTTEAVQEKRKERAPAQDSVTTTATRRRSTTASAPPSTSTQIPAERSAGYEQLGLTRELAAGPSLMSGPSLSLSLMPRTRKAAGKDVRAEPSAWAKEANAKRAGARSTRRTAAAVQEASQARNAAVAETSGGATDGTTIFMKRSGSHDLLNGASEKDLSNIVKDALFLERVKGELKDVLHREPSMAEWAKAVGMDPGTFTIRLNAGQHAKSVMLQANYRLVIAICKKYQYKGMALQDLITEGVRGLLTGVEKFDADKGFRFSTYAHWWIRQAVMRAISVQGREVRLPAHVSEILNRIKSAQAQLKEELSRDASIDEVSALVKLPPKRINEILAMGWGSGSLDALIGSEEAGGTMKDRLQDHRPTPDENLKNVMLGKEMDSILSDLTPREAGVIRLRFGLDGEQVVTLEEIGARFKLTRERIRQIEAKAIRTLKQKQNVFAGILQEHALAQAEGEMAARTSQGTNKSG